MFSPLKKRTRNPAEIYQHSGCWYILIYSPPLLASGQNYFPTTNNFAGRERRKGGVRYDSDTKKQRLMGGLIRKALIYFSFYIRSLDLVVAKRKFITSALVKCREHAMMKPALWSVAGNLPFLRDVRFSLSLFRFFSYQVFVPSFLFFGQTSEIYVRKISRLFWTHFFRFLMRCFFKVFRNDRYVWYLIVLFIRWFDCFEKLSSFILVNQGLNIRHALLRLLASSLFYDLRRKTELLTIAAHRWTSFEQCC